LRFAESTYQDVSWFYVPVQNAQGMSIGDGIARREHMPHQPGKVGRAGLFQSLSQRNSADQAHRVKRHTVGIYPGVIDRNNPRVL
jgi:hypothetical protein